MAADRRFVVSSFVLGVSCAALAMAALVWTMFANGFSARSRPGALETWLADFALRQSVPRALRELHNPNRPTPESLARGRDHFADHCATCHANNGDGHTMYGDGMSPAPPDLRLAATQHKSDGELYAIIQNGVRMTGMPAFGAPGEQDESTWELVGFIRHLPSLTADEARAMQRLNPISPSELEEEKEEDNFLTGTTESPKGSHP